MKPRIQLPSEATDDQGAAGSRPAPTISAARRRLRRIGFRLRGVDPVTTELVRMRNARFQHCNY
ncbi:MAG: hypothetical protein M0Z30_11830 [Actinomycetota bacterium]|nr:hypothetical protein [Actinomycetota bacterium]